MVVEAQEWAELGAKFTKTTPHMLQTRENQTT
jgi:hypothetical protein